MSTEPIYEVRKIKNLKDMLYSSVDIFGDNTAFMVKDIPGGDYRSISYQQFRRDVDALGTALLDMGLENPKIAVIGENRYEWAVTYMAIVNGVGTIVPFDKELPEEEIKYLIKASGISCMVYSGKFGNFLENLDIQDSNLSHFINMDADSDKGRHLSFGKMLKRGQERLERGERAYVDAEIDENEMKILLYTSGTTGMAKGVMLSHKNIISNLMSMCTMVNIKPDDIFFSVLPLHHTYECTCGFLTPIYRGSAIAYCEGLKYILKNMEEVKPTLFLGVPLIFEGIYKKLWRQAKKSGLDRKLAKAIKINGYSKKLGIDLSRTLFKTVHNKFGGRIRMFISGGAGIDPEVAKGFRDLGIFTLQGYGLTEMSPIVALNPDIKPKNAAAGVPLPGVDVKIQNPGEDGIGEVITKGDSLMLGYYNNQEATDEVIINNWFYTGDLGYLDQENYVYITGRKKNVIVTKNGKNIFPEELEFYLNRSEYIEESIIYGKEDINSGETYVYAQIRPNDEAIDEALNAQYTDEQVHEFIQQEVDKINKDLPFYKKIRKISIRKDEFAKTTSKKIKRHLELPEA